jgi:2-amino-4-hydroxy-6-hydroxymethyldihydropteridine diphosphokinase
MALVALSLGSNIEPGRNLLLAVAMLRGAGRIVGVSRVFETDPVDVTGGPLFLNAAVLFETALDPSTLKRDVIGGIERALGRVREPGDRNAPRTIDIDILYFGEKEVLEPDLVIPHPRLAQRRFVLVPLSTICPDRIIKGTGRTVRQLLRELPECDVRFVQAEW